MGPHPFEKLFENALRKSTPDANVVLEKAEELRDAGYNAEEVRDVLKQFSRSLLIDEEAQIAQDALDVFSEDLED